MRNERSSAPRSPDVEGRLDDGEDRQAARIRARRRPRQYFLRARTAQQLSDVAGSKERYAKVVETSAHVVDAHSAQPAENRRRRGPAEAPSTPRSRRTDRTRQAFRRRCIRCSVAGLPPRAVAAPLWWGHRRGAGEDEASGGGGRRGSGGRLDGRASLQPGRAAGAPVTRVLSRAPDGPPGPLARGQVANGWRPPIARAFEPLVVNAPVPGTAAAIRSRGGSCGRSPSFVADAKARLPGVRPHAAHHPHGEGPDVGHGIPRGRRRAKQPGVRSVRHQLLSGLHRRCTVTTRSRSGRTGELGRRRSLECGTARPDDLDRSWVENVSFGEVHQLHRRVLSSVAAYAYLYDRKAYDDVLAIPIKLAK